MTESPVAILFDVFGSQIATVSGIDGVRLATSVDGSVGIDPDNVGGLALETTVSGAAQTLTSLDLKDFATETKLEAVRVILQSIDSKDLATEATSSGIAQLLTSINNKDFSTESTLSSLRADFNSEDFASEATLSGLAQTSSAIEGKDFSTEATLAGFRSDFVSEDFSSETTLSGLAQTTSLLEAKDFATETTLSGVNISVTDIRDNQGIKRINDPLPAGSNVIGKVRLRDPSDTVDLGDVTNPLRTDPIGGEETSGTITVVSGTVEASTHGSAMVSVQIAGTWEGTIAGQATIDGTTWFSVVGFQVGGTGAVSSTTENGVFRANVNGFTKMRVIATAWTSGTALVDINPTVRVGQVPIDGNGNVGVRVVSTAPPAGVAAVIIAADSPLVVGTSDTDYIIPNGQNFYLQQLTGGNEDPSKGASVTLIYYDGTTEHVIHRDYFAGATHSTIFPDVSTARDGTAMIGDGATKLIRVRRAKFSGTDIAIDAVVYGYSQ